MVYTPSDRELEIMRVEQDIGRSFRELTDMVHSTLELIYEIKTDYSRLGVLQTQLEEMS